MDIFDIKPEDSIIVIGNGPNILVEPKGDIIDSFDHVIRFNRYKIKDLEEYTGIKTSIWATFGRGEIPTDEDQRPSKILFTHGDRGNPAYTPDILYRIPLDFYYNLLDKIKSISKLENVEKLLPSSGILVIHYLATHIANKIHIRGFDNFQKEVSGQHHYWINKNFSKPKEHDGIAERTLIQDLVVEEKVVVV